MAYIPTTDADREQMLAAIGVPSVDSLFESIPQQIRDRATLDTPSVRTPLGEYELRRYFDGLAKKNEAVHTHFLGGGTYDNVIPAVVDQLVLRGEFLTCYTPYQPEVSQGTLQAIFEFQTMIARITGCEVANASMYDGATAAAEAALMALRVRKNTQSNTLVAASLPPDYRTVINTYLACHAPKPIEFGWDAETGEINREELLSLVSEYEPASVVVPFTNDFGGLEDIAGLKEQLPDNCLLIVAAADPSAMSIYEPPGKLGADIVVGEAHQLGTPMLFGGPHCGLFATKKKYIRQSPGRLCGESVDADGNRAYTLTMSTREQHIRREKATSNICTNQGLIALRTTIYLSFLGKAGFDRLGVMNHSLLSYLKDKLADAGVRPLFPGSSPYRELAVRVPDLDAKLAALLGDGVAAGIPLADRHPGHTGLDDALLICVHPKHTREDLDRLVAGLSG